MKKRGRSCTAHVRSSWIKIATSHFFFFYSTRYAWVCRTLLAKTTIANSRIIIILSPSFLDSIHLFLSPFPLLDHIKGLSVSMHLYKKRVPLAQWVSANKRQPDLACGPFFPLPFFIDWLNGNSTMHESCHLLPLPFHGSPLDMLR